MKECLAELNPLSSDEDETVTRKSYNCSHWLHSEFGLSEDLRCKPRKERVSCPLHVRPFLRAELRELMLLNNSEHSPAFSEEEKKQRADFVAEWIAELASTIFMIVWLRT